MGQISVQLSAGDKKISSCFVVTRSERCLLGHVTSKDLGLLHVGPGASSEPAKCNIVCKDMALTLQAKSPNVFSEMEKLNKFQLKLHIDPEI